MLAKLYSVNTRRVANERDFDSATGDLRKASPGSNSSSSSTSSSTAVATKPPASSPPGEVSAFDKDRLVVLDESMTQQLMAWLSGGVGGGGSKSTSTAGGKMASSALPPSSSPAPVFRVTDVDSRKTSRKPPPPFITSSLQQESSRKHGFSPSRTMGIAQSLYEKGHITYMRTDSPTLSATALIASQKMASKLFGADSLPSAGDLLETSAKKAAAKVGKEGGVPKNAQEAHEAIRPAEISGRFALPEDLAGLSQEEKTLYGLILRRTLASVMKPSQSATCTYTITASSSPVEGTGFTEAVFRSSDTRVIFPGFLVALDMFGKKVPAKGSFSTATQQEQGSILPGQVLKLSDRKDFSDLLRSSSSTEEGADGAGGAADAGLAQPSDGSEASASAVEVAPAPAFPGLNSARHTTRPPSRFTEASFIQEMEELGVGRPSTYSAILHTLKEREYIVVERQTIIPTIKGMVVCEFLAKHFPQFVDAQFTAEMEKNLDLIARGECDKVDFLSRFYLQDEPVSDTDKRAATLKKGLLPTIRQKLRSEEFNHADSRRLHVPFLQDIGVLTYSKNGASVETFVPQRAATNATGALSSEVTDREFSGLKWSLPEAMQQDIRGITSEAVRKLLEQESPTSGTVLGVLPGTQLKVYQKAGRYGRFVQVGEKSSAKFFSVPSWMNSSPRNLTLGDALDLIHLPRVLCMHAELNKSIVADMNRNVLSVGVEGFPLRVPVPEGLLVKDVTVEMALQLLPPAAEITSAGGSLGLWRDNPVVVVHGKFGPYVRSGMVVGGIKGDLANSTSSITLAQAVEILETRGKVLGGKFAKPGATAATPKAKKVPKTKAEKAPAAKLATKKAADNDALDGDQGVKPKRASSTEKTKFAAAAGAGGDSSPALGEKATTLTAVEAVNQPRRVVTKSGKTNVDMPPADTDKDGDGKGASVPKKATTRKPRSAPPSV